MKRLWEAVVRTSGAAGVLAEGGPGGSVMPQRRVPRVRAAAEPPWTGAPERVAGAHCFRPFGCGRKRCGEVAGVRGVHRGLEYADHAVNHAEREVALGQGVVRKGVLKIAWDRHLHISLHGDQNCPISTSFKENPQPKRDYYS